MAKRIILRTGEALVEGALDYLCAEPEIVIGELDGPLGTAMATLLDTRSRDIPKSSPSSTAMWQVKPGNLDGQQGNRQRSSLHEHSNGTVQAAIANGVLDAVRAGHIQRIRPTSSASSTQSGSILRSSKLRRERLITRLSSTSIVKRQSRSFRRR